jgi:hypothetical protein
MQPDIPLAALLDRLAEEASGLAAAAARAEIGLQLVLERVADLPAGSAADLQRLDLVRQSLEDFARLLWLAASVAAPPTDEVVHVARVEDAAKLTDLRARLAGGNGYHEAAAGTGDDLHLF